MNEEQELIEEVRQALITEGRVAYYNSSMTELMTRCVYCGDSQKDKTHAHFYVSVQAPYFFYCQRCNVTGYMSSDSLRDFELPDIDLVKRVSKVVKKKLKDTSVNGKSLDSLINSKRKLIIPEYDVDRPSFPIKVDYLEGRLGKSLDEELLRKLKVIPSLNDFLIHNNLENLDKYYKKSESMYRFKKFINKHSVGFLSTDTNFSTFRHLIDPPGSTRRYYTENHNRPYDLGNKIYTIANDIDILSPELNLIMTEGVMDISSVYLNIYDKEDRPNRLYCSANGKSFILVIKLLRRLGFLNINLDMFSDNDIELNYYKYLFNFNHFSQIKVHYNRYSGEKDFGVTLDKIKQKTYRLK